MTDMTSDNDALQARGLKERPLSPHLSIYKPIPTMVMSIMHRITGVALYGGSLLVAWWIIATATGPDAHAFATGVMGSLLGLIVLFGFTLALVHHMLGGLKHLVWDTGTIGEKDENRTLAIAQPIASIVITVAIWLIAFLTGAF